jgi:hypothetical protein
MVHLPLAYLHRPSAKVTVERGEEKELILPRTEIPERVTQVHTHKGCSSPFLVVFQSAGESHRCAHAHNPKRRGRAGENLRVRNVRITSQEIQLAKNQPAIDVRHRSRVPSRIRRKERSRRYFRKPRSFRQKYFLVVRGCCRFQRVRRRRQQQTKSTSDRGE